MKGWNETMQEIMFLNGFMIGSCTRVLEYLCTYVPQVLYLDLYLSSLFEWSTVNWTFTLAYKYLDFAQVHYFTMFIYWNIILNKFSRIYKTKRNI